MAIALVTGTSSGIGLATAITPGRAGHTVYAGERSLARGGDLQAVIAKEQLPVAVVQIDVDDEGSVSSAIQQVLAERSQIDWLTTLVSAQLVTLAPRPDLVVPKGSTVPP